MGEPRRKKVARTSIKRATGDRYLSYDVLRAIFKHLSGMELSNASIVCRAWLKAANDEKRTRGPVTFIDVNDTLCGLARTSVQRCSFKRQVVKDLPIKPGFGIFLQNGWKQKEKDWDLKILPPNCQALSLTMYGVISENKQYELKSMHNRSRGSTVWAFLPEIPDVTVKTFALPVGKNQGSSTENFTSNLLEAVRKTPESRCLLIFSVKYVESIGRTLETIKQESPDVAVLGGIVEEITLHNSSCSNLPSLSTQTMHSVGILITGALRTWSIVVDVTHAEKDKFEKKLAFLKKRVQLRRHSMAFMFACYARGRGTYHEDDVEATIFKRVFPDVPLVGCFGSGEFGTSTVVDDEPPLEPETVYNELSTIFLLLTYD